MKVKCFPSAACVVSMILVFHLIVLTALAGGTVANKGCAPKKAPPRSPRTTHGEHKKKAPAPTVPVCSAFWTCPTALPLPKGTTNFDGLCLNNRTIAPTTTIPNCDFTNATVDYIGNWFVYTPTVNCNASLQINGTEPYFEALSGSCNNFTCLSQDATYGGFTQSLEWAAKAMVSYYIIAFSFNISNSNFDGYQLTFSCK